MVKLAELLPPKSVTCDLLNERATVEREMMKKPCWCHFVPTQPDEKTKLPKAILFLRRASWVCEKKGNVFSQPY